MRSNWRRAYEAARCEERETWRLCIHESAHALVAYTLGIKLKNLVVGRGVNDDSMSLQGYCAWKIRDDDPRSLVTAAIAGPSADAIFFDRSRSADSQDYRDARCAAERVVKAEGGEIETIIARARVDSESLIQQHATVIKKLAHELMQARWMELSGEQAEDILRRAGVKRSGASPGRSPLPGQERYFERRGGVDRATVNRDSDRRVAVFERRCDGYIA